MFLLVSAHPGCPGQIPQSRKTVVCVYVCVVLYLKLRLHVSLCIEHRQLEAIVRIAESLAKMRLAAFAVESDIDEALRLFQVSTLDAAMTGSLAGRSFSAASVLLPGCIIITYNRYFFSSSQQAVTARHYKRHQMYKQNKN